MAHSSTKNIEHEIQINFRMDFTVFSNSLIFPGY